MSLEGSGESEGAHDNQIVRSRRKYLQAAGGAGFGLIGWKPSGVGDGGTIEIVTKKSGDTPIETKVVSKEWYNQMQRARRVADSLKRQWVPGNGIRSIGLTAGDRTIGGAKTKEIDLRLKGETADINIPAQIDEIPIRVTKNERVDFHCYETENLQGGVNITTEATGGRLASVCCRVKRNGDHFLLTARHSFTPDGTGCDATNVEGDDVYRANFKLGTIDDSYPEHDSVIVKMDSSDISNSIVTESGTVDGYITKNGLDFYISQNHSMEKRGTETCATTAHPQSYDNAITCSSNIILTEIVFHGGSSLKGDSGGVVYDGSSSISISNMHSGKTAGGNLFGAAAYAMNNQQNLTFDT